MNDKVIKTIVRILRLNNLFVTDAFVATILELNTLVEESIKGNGIESITLKEIDIIFTECKNKFPENIKG